MGQGTFFKSFLGVGCLSTQERTICDKFEIQIERIIQGLGINEKIPCLPGTVKCKRPKLKTMGNPKSTCMFIAKGMSERCLTKLNTIISIYFKACSMIQLNL